MGKYYEKLKAYIWKDNPEDDYIDEEETDYEKSSEKEKNN
jgi:hypothetical protein